MDSSEKTLQKVLMTVPVGISDEILAQLAADLEKPYYERRWRLMSMTEIAIEFEVTPTTTKRWFERGEFAPHELWRVGPMLWCLDMEAVTRLKGIKREDRWRQSFTQTVVARIEEDLVEHLHENGWEEGQWVILTTRQAADFARVSTATLWRWIQNETLIEGVDYDTTEYGRMQYNLDSLAEHGKVWKETRKPGGGRPKREEVEAKLAAYEEFLKLEMGLKDLRTPSERLRDIDLLRADPQHIKDQAKSSRATKNALVNSGYRNQVKDQGRAVKAYKNDMERKAKKAVEEARK